MRPLALILLFVSLRAGAADLRLHLLDQQLNATPDSTRATTTGILIATTAALIAWDAYLAANHHTTESRIVMDASWKYSTIPLLAGGLAGHFFFNQPKAKNRVWPWGAAVISGVLAWDLTRRDSKNWTRHPAIWFTVGLGTGVLTWGQKGP